MAQRERTGFGSRWLEVRLLPYVIDYERGTDILRFNQSAPRPSTAEIEASWLARMGDTDPLAVAERNSCKLGQQ